MLVVSSMASSSSCHRLVDRGFCRFGCTISSRACHAYGKGHCWRGAGCRYLHGPPGQRKRKRDEPEGEGDGRDRQGAAQRSQGSPSISQASARPRAPTGEALDEALIIFNVSDRYRLTLGVVRALYKAFSLEMHPDRATTDAQKKVFTEAFTSMGKAYEVLVAWCESDEINDMD